MTYASVDEFAVSKRQFALNGAREDLKPATLAVGAEGANEGKNVAIFGHTLH
jgi:hypothetical protein